MISYDNRTYYDKRNEYYYDPEWEAAWNTGEAKRYYKCILKDPFRGDRVSIHLYTPAVAVLIQKRLGKLGNEYSYEEITEGRRKDGSD